MKSIRITLRGYVTTILTLALLAAMLISTAAASYEPKTDYMSLMVQAVMTGDIEAGAAAEAARNEKIEDMALSFAPVVFDDLRLISKIIQAEAGSEWLSDEWKMSVGEIVLNRVASPEFPNTIKEVLEQPAQYYGKSSRYFNNIVPSARSADAARRVLSGERVINDPSVVFQANFRQGSGVHTALYDSHLGWTYFCYSRNPALYVVANNTENENGEESNANQ